MAALQTAAGDVTAPVKSPQGYYVLKVLERAAPNMAELPAERERLSKEVLAQKQSQAWEAWVSGARANARVETFAGATRAPRRS
jgi:parvulin-like peptidyl-prolyl isomerase